MRSFERLIARFIILVTELLPAHAPLKRSLSGLPTFLPTSNPSTPIIWWHSGTKGSTTNPEALLILTSTFTIFIGLGDFAHNAYRGGEGIDFDANLKISSLDFGTFHVRCVTYVYSTRGKFD